LAHREERRGKVGEKRRRGGQRKRCHRWRIRDARPGRKSPLEIQKKGESVSGGEIRRTKR